MDAKDSVDLTALHVILKNCQKFSTKPALHWLDGNCKITEQYSYEEVEIRTRELAHGLLNLIQRKPDNSSDVLVKERAVLCYPPGLEFILTFLGCLRAGIIAVPVSPPNPHQPDYSMEMIVRIIHDCGAAFVLTSKEFANHENIIKVIKTSPVPWHCEVDTEILPEESSESEIYQLLDQAKPEDIPFLQYTSGSTGTPKGVMPTHHTLLHNFQLMQEIMDTDNSMVEISFLPHYHAMGLICSYLQTLYHGGMGYFMSPVTFLENPGLWIKAFSLFHGTHAKAPNFAFDLVVRKGFPKTIDLSTARNLVSASEPVCIETIKEFESALAPHGLKRNTVRAGYGLAEHTVYLSGVRNHTDPVIIDGRISCGVPTPGVIVKVVDPETCTVMPEGEEGEIWVDSPSKALGYWEKEEKTLRIFEAQLDELSDRTYLRTGDLGFMKDGELFVSGRLKNVIIIHGRNIHPSDIEMRIESSFPMLQSGRTIACEYTPEHFKDSLGIAYIAEIRSPKSYSLVQLDSLSKQISTMIGLNFQIDVNLVVFINPRTMPCTMSGKRQRSLCKKKLVSNKLKEVYRWSRRSVAYQTRPPPVHPKTDRRTLVMDKPDSISEPESTMDLVQPVLQQSAININILEPSDSESNIETLSILDSSSEPNSRNDTVFLESSPPLASSRDSTLKKLTVHYPEVVRTERRKSAPPIPVDHESQVKAISHANYPRRKSTLDRTCSLSRLYKRRNSLQTLTDTVSGVLGVQLQPDSNIWAHGCNSIKVHQLSQSLQSEFGFVVEPHHLFIHQTPKALLGKLQRSLLSMTSPPSQESNQLDETLATVDECGGLGLDTLHEDVDENEDRITEQVNTSATAAGHGCDIAIVGMACTFAGCNNTEELWELLISKQVTTTSHFVPSSHQMLSGGFTPTVGVFDYNWFGVPEWEAGSMDPQQSMLLHTAWECLENAATCTKEDKSEALYGSECGVFVGISMDNDAHFVSRDHTVTPLPTSISSSVAANRIARAFNLKGPVMSIDTACASSLSALDVACKFLRDGDCSTALVCGVNAILDPYRYTLLNRMGILSPDEQCKVFDASANGYVRGEGCGAVLLMPLSQAEKEGRRILAVVKSTVSNNNGALSATLTSPSGKDQETLITKALRKAHISTKDVAYIEAHGTGTKLGDPIEVDAIQAVFGLDKQIKTEHIQIQMESKEDKKMKRDCCNRVMVGSVKANVGHLETGAGIAGLIKSVMVLEHSMAPGNACLDKLNPCFRLSDNICISSENLPLEAPTKHPPSPLAGVVNSFGFGGTNVTTVLQQYTLLPHMAQSECTILFSIDAQCEMDQRLKDIAAAVVYLCSRFPAFREAMTTCDTVIQQTAANLGEMCLNVEKATVVKFYYALVALCQALGMKFTTVGGLDVIGEVLSLVIVNSLNLSHALIFILTPWPSAYAEEMQTLIRPPTIPLFSCILEKVCYPPTAEIGSSEYCMQMVSKLREKNNPSQCSLPPVVTTSFAMERLLSIVESNNTHPILSLTLDSSINLKRCSKSTHVIINASEFNFTENGVRVEHYIREKLIELRNASDRVRMTKCVSRPMKSLKKVMPDFHKRYPLRAVVDPQLQVPSQASSPLPSEGGRVQKKTSPNADNTPQTPSTPQTPQTPSPLTSKSFDAGGRNQINERKLSTLSSSSSVESGYITQENSRESLPTSVPPNTPISMSTGKSDSKKLEYKLDREQLALALKENQLSDKEYERWEVVSNIMEEIKDDLDSSDISLEEFARSGMYDLGLDSLNVMHTADFLSRTYNIKMTFSDVVDYGTVGQLAAFIVEQSPVFKSRCDLSSSLSTLQLMGVPPDSSDLYPILTKEGYYTEPPLKDLRRMQPSAHSHNSSSSLHLFINDFTIGRKGVGKIVFPGETDVAQLNLDKLVYINEKAVHLSAYQPGSDRLNKPVMVHFENVYLEGKSKADHKALVQTLQEYCMNAKPPMQFVSHETDFGVLTTKMEKFY